MCDQGQMRNTKQIYMEEEEEDKKKLWRQIIAENYK